MYKLKKVFLTVENAKDKEQQSLITQVKTFLTKSKTGFIRASSTGTIKGIITFEILIIEDKVTELTEKIKSLASKRLIESQCTISTPYSVTPKDADLEKIELLSKD